MFEVIFSVGFFRELIDYKLDPFLAPSSEDSSEILCFIDRVFLFVLSFNRIRTVYLHCTGDVPKTPMSQKGVCGFNPLIAGISPLEVGLVIRGPSVTQGSMGRDPPRYPPRGPQGRI